MSPNKIKFGSVWAQDTNGVLGSGEEMLWRVPADQQFFKVVTMGAPIVFGRSSWDAQRGALKGRTNIVITRDLNFEAPGAVVTHSINDALQVAADQARKDGLSHAWITGGAQIYEQTMDVVDELIVSEMDLTLPEVGPRVFAPEIDPAIWKVDPERSDSQWRPKSGDARWKVVTYVRR